MALEIAVNKLMAEGKLKESPIKERLGALSVGLDKDGLSLPLFVSFSLVWYVFVLFILLFYLIPTR